MQSLSADRNRVGYDRVAHIRLFNLFLRYEILNIVFIDTIAFKDLA